MRCWQARCRLFDLGEHCREIGEHIIVAEAEDLVAVLRQVFGAGGVLLDVLVVHGAINFDGEMGGRAVEVEHEWPDRVLAAKAKPGNPPTAQCLPEHLLGGR